MTETICPNCGHAFTPTTGIIRPNDKCCCDIYEWPEKYSNGTPLPPVCKSFLRDYDGKCNNCEHDEGCHE